MKRNRYKGIVWCLSAVLLLPSGVCAGTVAESNAAADYGLHNPRVEMQTRDTIYFGNYWQEDTNEDGVVNQNDKKTPIKWQVLEQKDGELFLLADSVLDFKPYNEDSEGVTWKTSTLRNWLNGEFYDAAFSEEEKAAVKATQIRNEKNPKYETGGGEDTKDNVFLPSFSEITNVDFGFQKDGCRDQTRQGKATGYAREAGCSPDMDGTNWWWLRSPGDSADCAASVDSCGNVDYEGAGVESHNFGIRPVLRVNAANAKISVLWAKREKKEVALAKSVWDTVIFGRYQGADITWRVLSVDGEDAFLLADRILEKGAYHKEREDVTWEKCTLRKWLNNDFYKEAFSEKEQAAIRPTIVKNEDNPLWKTAGGNDTTDYIYLLSPSDVVNLSYGFPTAYQCDSSSRQADGEAVGWWLRSPGYFASYAMNVGDDGDIGSFGCSADYSYEGVRPALHLNLSFFGWVKGEEEMTTSTNINKTPQTGGSGTGKEVTSKEVTGKEVTANKGKGNSTAVVTAPSKVKSLRIKNKKKKTVTVSYKKVNGAKGYQLQYARNKKFTKGKKSKTVKKTSVTIKKLKKKKTYYFRVRAYKLSNKKKVYGKWSRVKRFKVKK